MTEAENEVPVLLSHNDYILKQTELIRSKLIPWEGYSKALLIDEKELEMIKNFNPKHSTGYEQVFAKLLEKLSRIDTIQSILVLYDDYIVLNHTILVYNHQIFFKLLQKEDEYIQLKSAKIIVQGLLRLYRADSSVFDNLAHINTSTVAVGNTSTVVDGNNSSTADGNTSSTADGNTSAGTTKTTTLAELQQLFRWLVLQVSSLNLNIVDIGLQLLLALLSIRQFRDLFFDIDGGVACLVNVLKGKGILAQLQYQCIYCFWLLSFTSKAGLLEG
jgi:V-type H+-transporting ATPase subunit H